MHIYFLRHSAVCVVMDKALLIFDYFLHKPGKRIQQGFIGDDDIRNAQRVYVFVSHCHHDHYNPCIFEWARLNSRITYILDSALAEEAPQVNAVFLERGKEYCDGYLYVQEFGSTDIGGSFYVRCEGTRFFHAGDLNCWHWQDDGNEKYSRVMRMYFDRELRFLRHRVNHIDYAFFPVDKRMGSGHDEGADLFIDTMCPDVFIPIHFMHFEDTQAYSDKKAAARTKVLAVHRYGEKLI